MQKLTYDGKEYRIKYRHERLKDGHDKILPKGGKTIAYIKLEDETIINADALCSKKDTYCKEMGRRISLGRLKQVVYFKEHPEEEKAYYSRKAELEAMKQAEQQERAELQKKVWSD